jgi:hypothetical protein
MLVTLPLKDMSIEEKLQAMETLWEDLCRNADSLHSPSWHLDILRDRERMVKDGDDEFVSWEDAKNNIRNTVS